MQQTQLDAYHAIKESLCRRRRAVMGAFESLGGSATTFEVQKHLGWPVNRVSGRITELRESGFLTDSGTTRINPESGHPGTVWIMTGKTEQPEMF